MLSFLRHNKGWFVLAVLTIVLLYCGVVKITAATQMSYFTDEPEDAMIVASDISTAPYFFESSRAPDQARLPHLVALPITLAFSDQALLATRVLYIFIHIIYLCLIYKLFRLHVSRLQALYGFALTALSSYLFSFSIFTMTSSNNLYLLFGTLVVYLYMKQPRGTSSANLRDLTLLGITLGLALGTRFLSAIILGTIFVYDAWSQRDILRQQKDTFKQLWKFPYSVLNGGFCVAIIIINLMPRTPYLQIGLTAVTVVGYMILLGREYRLRNTRKLPLSFLQRWLLIGSTATVFTFLASPVHLNLRNIMPIFQWSSIWHKTTNFINPSWFDIFTVIGVKTGWIVGILIALAIGLIAWRRQMGKFVKTYALPILLVIIHMLIFVKIKYIIAWYPLFLIPFFYLPFVYIFPKSLQALKRPSQAVLFVILMLIPLSEQYRYWRLFPYGHIDGAQYSRQYIGWNKPGIVTFEGLNQIATYLKQHTNELPPGPMRCELIQNSMYKNWSNIITNIIFRQQGVDGFTCHLEFF